MSIEIATYVLKIEFWKWWDSDAISDPAFDDLCLQKYTSTKIKEQHAFFDLSTVYIPITADIVFELDGYNLIVNSANQGAIFVESVVFITDMSIQINGHEKDHPIPQYLTDFVMDVRARLGVFDHKLEVPDWFTTYASQVIQRRNANVAPP
jgi:hypothetical protein